MTKECAICKGIYDNFQEADTCKHLICNKCINTQTKACQVCKKKYKKLNLVQIQQSDKKQSKPYIKSQQIVSLVENESMKLCKQLQFLVDDQSTKQLKQTFSRSRFDQLKIKIPGVPETGPEAVPIQNAISNPMLQMTSYKQNDSCELNVKIPSERSTIFRRKTALRGQLVSFVNLENASPIVDGVVQTQCQQLLSKLGDCEQQILNFQNEKQSLNKQIDELTNSLKQLKSENTMLEFKQFADKELAKFKYNIFDTQGLKDFVEQEVRPLNFQILALQNLTQILREDFSNFDDLTLSDQFPPMVEERARLIFDLAKIKEKIVNDQGSQFLGAEFINKLEQLLDNQKLLSLDSQDALQMFDIFDNQNAPTSRQHFGINGRMQIINGYKEIRAENITLKLKMRHAQTFDFINFDNEMNNLKMTLDGKIKQIKEQIASNYVELEPQLKEENVYEVHVKFLIKNLKDMELVDQDQQNDLQIINEIFKEFIQHEDVEKAYDETIQELNTQLQHFQKVLDEAQDRFDDYDMQLKENEQQLLNRAGQKDEKIRMKALENLVMEQQNKISKLEKELSQELIGRQEQALSYQQIIAQTPHGLNKKKSWAVNKIDSDNQSDNQTKQLISSLFEDVNEQRKNLVSILSTINDIDYQFQQRQQDDKDQLLSLNDKQKETFIELNSKQSIINTLSSEVFGLKQRLSWQEQQFKYQNLNQKESLQEWLCETKKNILTIKQLILHELEEYSLVFNKVQTNLILKTQSRQQTVIQPIKQQEDQSLLIHGLNSKIQDGALKIDILQSQLNVLREQNSKLKEELSKQKLRFDELNGDLFRMQKQNTQQKQQIDATDIFMKQLGDKFSLNFVKNLPYEQMLDQLMAQIDSNLSCQQQQLQAIQQDRDVLDAENFVHKQELACLKHQLVSINPQIEDNEILVLELNLQVDTLKEKTQLQRQTLTYIKSNIETQLNEMSQCTVYKLCDKLEEIELLQLRLDTLSQTIQQFKLEKDEQISLMLIAQTAQQTVSDELKQNELQMATLVDSMQELDNQNSQLAKQLAEKQAQIEHLSEVAEKAAQLQYANDLLRQQLESFQKAAVENKVRQSDSIQQIGKTNKKLQDDYQKAVQVIKNNEKELERLKNIVKLKDMELDTIKLQGQSEMDRLLKCDEEEKVQQFRQLFDQTLVMEHDITFITMMRYVFFKKETKETYNKLTMMANDLKQKLHVFNQTDVPLEERFRAMQIFIQTVYNFYCNDFPDYDVHKFIAEYDMMFTQLKADNYGAEARNEILNSYKKVLMINMQLTKEVDALKRKLPAPQIKPKVVKK